MGPFFYGWLLRMGRFEAAFIRTGLQSLAQSLLRVSSLMRYQHLDVVTQKGQKCTANHGKLFAFGPHDVPVTTDRKSPDVELGEFLATVGL